MTTIKHQTSRHTSARGLVSELEKVIREHRIVSATERSPDSSEFVFTIQAFPWLCDLTADPWSDRAAGDFVRVVEGARRLLGVEVEVTP